MVHRLKFPAVALFFLNCFLFFSCLNSFAAEADLVSPGDTVAIQFTCRSSNGEIVSSTSSAVAANSSVPKSVVFQPRSKDDPVFVQAGPVSHKKSFPIAFEDEIAARIGASLAGLKAGESRTIAIRSERPADVPEKDQSLQMALVRQRPKEITMRVDKYKLRIGKDPKEGDDVRVDPLIAGKVAAIKDNQVFIRYSAKTGDQIDTPFGKGAVKENGDQLEITIAPVKGALVRMGPIVGRISDVQEKVFTIDFGDPLGGAPLTCDIKVESIDKKQKQAQ
jgi:FKBP-type peptidyl-prolyl cis-trans isomerase 2